MTHPPWKPGDILIRRGLRRLVVRTGKRTCTWLHYPSGTVELTTWIEDMIAVGWEIERKEEER